MEMQEPFWQKLCPNNLCHPRGSPHVVEYRLSTRKGVSEGLILDLSSAESTTAVKATGPCEIDYVILARLASLLLTSALLHKSHIRSRPAFRRLFDGPELRLVPVEVLPERPPDALGVSRADDRAAQKFSLRAVRENVNKIQRELFQVVVNHHQVAVLPLQCLFIRLDLHLPWRWLLLIHLFSLPEYLLELTISPWPPLGSFASRLLSARDEEQKRSPIDKPVLLSVV